MLSWRHSKVRSILTALPHLPFAHTRTLAHAHALTHAHVRTRTPTYEPRRNLALMHPVHYSHASCHLLTQSYYFTYCYGSTQIAPHTLIATATNPHPTPKARPPPKAASS
jgi:hypothetical protein